jgi:superfamily II DNA or RNA helicase
MNVRIVHNDLKRAIDQSDFQLHCAALEWSLSEPIIIDGPNDIKSSVDWKDRLQPFEHQVQNLIRFCRRLPVTLLADDVGLGKTISAGLIVSELLKRSKIKRVFVICPKILVNQWVEELESKFGITAVGATGSELHSISRRTETVVVTTYQSATNYLATLKQGTFDLLVLDEAHKLRNLHGTQNSPQMALMIRRALELRTFKYVVMLTATPIQNRLWDIYSLIDCLAVARGHRNPFGDPNQFASRYIQDGKTSARQLNPRTAEEFRSIVRSYMFRTRRIDAKLVFPDRKVRNYPVAPSDGERQLQKLVAKEIKNLNALQQSSLLVALMSSPQALASQLGNMSNEGWISPGVANRAREIADQIAIPAKARRVLEIANQLRQQSPNWRMVVFTTRKETQKIIGEVLEKSGIGVKFISGGQSAGNQRAINSFRSDPPTANVIVSTDAGAEGVNLQMANILVNYDLPWNPMIVEQRIGRVQRIGSKFKNVFVANIVHEDSPEQRIVLRLMEKLQVIAHTVGDIEAVLDASNDQNGDSFEKQIREMVVFSLLGNDPQHAAKMAEESIDAAKKLIEENQALMDDTLGTKHDTEIENAPMPRLETKPPSLPLDQFVIKALESEGGRVERMHDGLYVVKSQRYGEERFTFDETVLERATESGVFLGRTPVLYQQGKPAFERLVQRWLDRSAAVFEDLGSDDHQIRSILEYWCSQFDGVKLDYVQTDQRKGILQGSVLCRTRVENAIDSYEKLISVEMPTPREAISRSLLTATSIDSRRVHADLEGKVRDAIENDPDINKFLDFYRKRLEQEVARSDAGSRQRKLESDYTPSITAEASAVSGALKDVVVVKASIEFDGLKYSLPLIEISGGSIINSPEAGDCQISNCRLPVVCLGTCSVTGKTVKRSSLVRSDESGLFALKDHTGLCQQSGATLLKTELERCSVSGKIVSKKLLGVSAVSEKHALKDLLGTCAITGAKVLPDELISSGVSNLRFRKDQSVILADRETVAHESEACKCHGSGKWHRKHECFVSDASGKAFHESRKCFSEKSQRCCDQSELVACQDTGIRLLEDELGTCSITGKRVSRDLLRHCPETGESTTESNFGRCSESGVLVLKSSLVALPASNAMVRRSLVRTSDYSGRMALAKVMIQSAATGKFMLPEEAQKCPQTQKLVGPGELLTCAETGEKGLPELFVKSGISSNFYLKKNTKTLSNGLVVGKTETSICFWTKKYVKAADTGICKLCGLEFHKNFLNASGEFRLLREALDGETNGEEFPDPTFLARVAPNHFTGIKGFQWITSPATKSHVLFGSKSFFGLNARHFAVMAEGDLSMMYLRGKPLMGKRVKGVWVAAE